VAGQKGHPDYIPARLRGSAPPWLYVVEIAPRQSCRTYAVACQATISKKMVVASHFNRFSSFYLIINFMNLMGQFIGLMMKFASNLIIFYLCDLQDHKLYFNS
jgi:hypothetical protein